MSSLNRVVFVGRVTKDPEPSFTNQGIALTKFSIAVNRFTKKDNGDYETDFFDVVCWRKTAEFVGNYIKKGRLVSIDGRAQQETWVDKETGKNRSKVVFTAESVQGLDSKRDDAEASEESAKPAAPANYDDGVDPFAE